MTSALLKLPQSLSRQKKEERVEQILTELVRSPQASISMLAIGLAGLISSGQAPTCAGLFSSAQAPVAHQMGYAAGGAAMHDKQCYLQCLAYARRLTQAAACICGGAFRGPPGGLIWRCMPRRRSCSR